MQVVSPLVGHHVLARPNYSTPPVIRTRDSPRDIDASSSSILFEQYMHSSPGADGYSFAATCGVAFVSASDYRDGTTTIQRDRCGGIPSECEELTVNFPSGRWWVLFWSAQALLWAVVSVTRTQDGASPVWSWVATCLFAAAAILTEISTFRSRSDNEHEPMNP